jgi:hypothetical protein
MMSADLYRQKGQEFLLKAAKESSHLLQVEYAQMAQSYFRLAEMAESNEKTDVVYETPRNGLAGRNA